MFKGSSCTLFFIRKNLQAARSFDDMNYTTNIHKLNTLCLLSSTYIVRLESNFYPGVAILAKKLIKAEKIHFIPKVFYIIF